MSGDGRSDGTESDDAGGGTRRARARWEARHAAAAGDPPGAPDPVLAAHRTLLGAAGRHPGDERAEALDVACGAGHNALWLAREGFRAVGIDVSTTALRRARAAAVAEGLPARFVAADLDRFPLPAARFALVVVVKFLDRGLAPAIVRALAPGGVLFYRTFNQRFLARKPGFNRDYVLADGELGRLFRDLEPVAGNEHADDGEPLSFLLARRAPARGRGSIARLRAARRSAPFAPRRPPRATSPRTSRRSRAGSRSRRHRPSP